MKKTALLVAILFTYGFSIAQPKKGGFESVIKKNKIKSCINYFFKNENDSVIIKEDFYDKEGFLISSTMSYDNNIYTAKDTFFYDKNHYLIKKISYDKSVQRDVSTFIYDEEGKMVQQNYLSDTFGLKIYRYYDKYKQLSRSIAYDSKGDSSIFEDIYNKKGLIVKNIFYNKENGKSTIVNKYNAASQLIKTINKSKNSESTKEYKYAINGDIIETNMESIIANKKIYTKNIYSYFAKGLIFETVHFMHHKPYAATKNYYAFYE